MCCVASRIDKLPQTPPSSVDLEVATTRKEAFAICPYMQVTEDGRFTCGVHDKKDHDSLSVCRKWLGNDRFPPDHKYSGRTKFEVLDMAYKKNLIASGMPEDIMIAEELIKRGALSGEFPQLLSFWMRTSIEFLKRCLAPPFTALPVNILEKYGAKEYINDLFEGGILLRNFDMFELDLKNPLHLQFFKEYFPESFVRYFMQFQ